MRLTRLRAPAAAAMLAWAYLTGEMPALAQSADRPSDISQICDGCVPEKVVTCKGFLEGEHEFVQQPDVGIEAVGRQKDLEVDVGVAGDAAALQRRAVEDDALDALRAEDVEAGRDDGAEEGG